MVVWLCVELILHFRSRLRGIHMTEKECHCVYMLLSNIVSLSSGAALEIFDGGPRSGGLGDGSPLVGSRGKAPVGGLGTKSPRS